MGEADLPCREEDIPARRVNGAAALDRFHTRAGGAGVIRQRDGFWDPPYWAHQGWIGTPLEGADWTEIEELIDTSFRQVALKRQIAELDSRGSR